MDTDGYVCILATPRKPVGPDFTGTMNSFVIDYPLLYEVLSVK